MPVWGPVGMHPVKPTFQADAPRGTSVLPFGFVILCHRRDPRNSCFSLLGSLPVNPFCDSSCTWWEEKWTPSSPWKTRGHVVSLLAHPSRLVWEDMLLPGLCSSPWHSPSLALWCLWTEAVCTFLLLLMNTEAGSGGFFTSHGPLQLSLQCRISLSCVKSSLI